MKRTFGYVGQCALIDVSMIPLAPFAAIAQESQEQDAEAPLSGTGRLADRFARHADHCRGANSTAQLLASVPHAASFNAAPIVSAINSSQIRINRPNLRNLPGASGGGSSTLILVDGHRPAGMSPASPSREYGAFP
ncbi:hypothetical protein [Novosphingobium sp. BL-52-GroH]|uniref:hypothetical protein n=1 Tax=Novosphingobium sp. BL-52-GroH TaxID=3349877 RepID=UPI00384BF947